MNTHQLLSSIGGKKPLPLHASVTGLLGFAICALALRNDHGHWGVCYSIHGDFASVLCFIGLVTAFIYFAMITTTELVTSAFCLSAAYAGSGAGHAFAWARRTWRKRKLGA